MQRPNHLCDGIHRGGALGRQGRALMVDYGLSSTMLKVDLGILQAPDLVEF